MEKNAFAGASKGKYKSRPSRSFLTLQYSAVNTKNNTMISFTAQDIPDLSGQVIIVTGGNAGLGLETIRQLIKHNPTRVYLAARSRDKAQEAIRQLKEAEPSSAPIEFLHFDLSSFKSIKAAVATFTSKEKRLDVLINNAGIMMTPPGLTEDGYETQFGTNVIGTALFTQLLMPILQATAKLNPETRVVNLASVSEAMATKDTIYKFDLLKTTMSEYNTTVRYTLSKLADVNYTTALSERYPDVKCISVEPGMVATNLHHASTGFFLKPFLNVAVKLFATPVENGALSQIWAAVSPDAVSGEFYSPVGVTGKGSELSRSREKREQLWERMQKELVGHV